MSRSAALGTDQLEGSDIPVSQASPTFSWSDTGWIVGQDLLYTTMSTAVYLRVSTGQQSVDQQHDVIAAAGIIPDRVFTDTASGRAGSSRPGWTECIGWLREGDELVVAAVDRLGRSVREVATALHELTTRGIHVRSLREGVDTSTPTGRAITSIMATIAELELELGK